MSRIGFVTNPKVGTCSACGRRLFLLRNGTLRFHSAGDFDGDGFLNCAGSGLPPKSEVKP